MIKFITYLLKNEDVAKQIALADNPPEEFNAIAQKMGYSIKWSDLPSPKYSDDKWWQIFTRIRFEYVSPYCKGRTPGNLITSTPSISEEEFLAGSKKYLESCFNAKSPVHMNELETMDQNSLGYHLYLYYKSSGIPVPGKNFSLFPPHYIYSHDLHHVLLGVDTSPAGELQVLAFEEALILRGLFPTMLLEYIEIACKSADVLPGFVEADKLAYYWNIGLKTSLHPFEISTIALTESLQDVRDFFNIHV